ncbi:ABC transporter ATP-binding protein [Paenibacillus donghaensis]|uniref:ABC transporter ATP-binding protein n=1 Tax=Paenibacillus donghaensis TaxID=414771 RepID=UPI00188344BF|nr:ABC transporter ATP-binding protein [Paenibacillus donghaensis]MBE9918318.1 ABC transporter ATP-binding protein [Paenibacillus donghaensis]
MLEVINLTHQFQNGPETTTVLSGVDFTVAQGEMVALWGSSGSGKSTLLHLMAGLMKPTNGSIRIAGEAIEQMNENQLAAFRRSHIGFVFQAYELIHHLTIQENVELPLVFAAIGSAARAKRAKDMLARVGLEGKESMFPSQLSGGQQQRVSIARALVSNPPLVFADEPTGNLDTRTEEEIVRLLIELNRSRSTTFVIVTHEHEVAERTGRLIQLVDGRIVDRKQREEAIL